MKTILQTFVAVLFVLITGRIAAAIDNPPAPGFDAAGSDTRAIAVADEVMERLGGRDSWDRTHFVTWRFFGKRRHVWDKWTGDLRYESGDLTVLMNINTQKGRAWQAGVEITDADTLAAKLQHGYRAWINDSYWMFMPFKLEDSGVTLKYRGEGKAEDGRAADVLVLTFEEVGVTPQNKYEVWVDKETRLVTQWSFYADAGDAEPRFVRPWENWKQYGRIWLSDGRGSGKHTEIAVFDELPRSVFTDPQPVDVMSLVE